MICGWRSNQCRAGQFADDISLWTTNSNKKITFLRMQRALSDIEAWCSKWRIKLNVAKTQLFCTSLKRQKRELKLFGRQITETNELSLLGVTFDKRHSFIPHCRKKAAEGMRRVQLLRVVSGRNWGANRRTLLKLYKQFIRPVLDYGHVSTYMAAGSGLELLQRVQNSALRLALRAHRRTSIAGLHAAAGMEVMAARLHTLKQKSVGRFADSECVRALATQSEVMALAE